MMNKYVLFFCFALVATRVAAQPAEVKSFTLIGFMEDTLKRPGFGNAQVFFEQDTVRVDSMPFKLSTAGIGSGFLVNNTLTYYQNGDIARGIGNSIPHTQVIGFSTDWPAFYNRGRPIPQGSTTLYGGKNLSQYPEFITYGHTAKFHHFDDFSPYAMYEARTSFRVNSNQQVLGLYDYDIVQQDYDSGVSWPSLFRPTRAAVVQAGFDIRNKFHLLGEEGTNRFYVGIRYSYSGWPANGANGLWRTFIPPNATGSCQTKGASVTSPQGDRYALWGDCKVQIMDFDRCSGKLSNYREVFPPEAPMVQGGGLVFSPSGRYLYVADYHRLYRIDMQAPDLQMEIAVITWAPPDPNDKRWHPGTSFSYMYLAPDDKVYIAPPHRAKHMHIITNPEASDITEIGFKRRGLALPVYNLHTIPANFNPHLGLKPGGGNLCDTVTVALPPELNRGIGLLLQPNPVQDQLYWELTTTTPGSESSNASYVQVVNAVGQVIFEEQQAKGATLGYINTEGWPTGMYFLRIETTAQSVIAAKVLKL